MSCKGRVGVLGASSIVGEYLLPLLVEEGWDVVAFSRREQNIKPSGNGLLTWQLLAQSGSTAIRDLHQKEKQITCWISLAPIAVLPEYFHLLLTYGARQIVAVSSTSRFTKKESSDRAEKKLAEKLAENEKNLSAWAKKEKLTFTILRPTLIYSPGRDKNVSVIAAFIRRFSFFCVFGEARGLRQPIYAQDVAFACVAALKAEQAANHCYNISGGETIDYREMVCRVFSALGRKPRFVVFPLWLFRLAIFILRIFPPFRHWSAAMAERMNQDLVFDHAEATRDLNFSPRNFQLKREDFS
ncbi:MAG: epimerase [Deltaproteobacteria bacterium HGW-Deltaproteobacteria-13]|jgi:nucleoside-diphosphate-sugar epimerase|nr:MAG: epimerase [Deltaproteobacteria bacterium HGW-Deltaproteobacteria-13]